MPKRKNERVKQHKELSQKILGNPPKVRVVPNKRRELLEKIDWYENREELREGLEFLCRDGSRVKLDRRVPGDGTKWYVADWYNGGWHYENDTIEPGGLIGFLPEEIERKESS